MKYIAEDSLRLPSIGIRSNWLGFFSTEMAVTYTDFPSVAAAAAEEPGSRQITRRPTARRHQTKRMPFRRTRGWYMR